MTDVGELFLRLPAARFEATEWARRYGDDVGSAWVECPRGDWLLYLAGILEIDAQALVSAACDCARFALSLLPDADAELGLIPVLELAERWTRGEASAEECRVAARGILYIYKTEEGLSQLPSAAPTSGYATAAVSAAVNLPTFQSAFGLACGASAAALAAAQVATPQDETAILAAHARCADLVRERIPFDLLAASPGFLAYAAAVTRSWEA